MTDSPTRSSRRGVAGEGAETFACHAARLLADSRCHDVIVQDLRGLSQVTDFFVIGTTASDRMMRSMSDELSGLADHEGWRIYRTSGTSDAQWMVVDMVDVVVHLFEENQRAFYDIESLWADAKPIDWQSRTTPGQFAKIIGAKKRIGRAAGE